MKRAISILLLLLVNSALPAFAATNAHGEELFSSNCAMCHPGGGNVMNPSKALKGEAFAKQFSKDSLIASVVRKGIPNTVMSPFPKERLSDAQLAEIIAYIRCLTPAPKGASSQPSKSAKPVSK
jgi:cytochrome c6